jgi:F0F1-type ATP synthase delta subunit
LACPSILIQATAAEHRGEEEVEVSIVHPLKQVQMLSKIQDTIIKSSQEGFWEARMREI